MASGGGSGEQTEAQKKLERLNTKALQDARKESRRLKREERVTRREVRTGGRGGLRSLAATDPAAERKQTRRVEGREEFDERLDAEDKEERRRKRKERKAKKRHDRKIDKIKGGEGGGKKTPPGRRDQRVQQKQQTGLQSIVSQSVGGI